MSRLLLGLSVLGVSATLVRADDFTQAQARRQIAEQKAESDVNDALAAAANLTPAAAERLLRSTLFALDTSVSISTQKRAELARLLEAKLSKAPATPTPAPAPVAAPADPTEAKAVHDAVQAVARAYALDQIRDAQAAITGITKQYPNNPVVVILNGQGEIAERVSVARQLAREQAIRTNLALRDVDAAALPIKGDIEFAKDFRAKMELRDKLSGVQLTDEELRILQALDTPIESAINGPFQEVLQGFSDRLGIPLIIDMQALADDNKDATKPVSLPAGVSARTALRVMVQSLGMTYIVKDKVIQVVTYEEARRSLVKRVYYLGDVLGGPTFNGVTVGPAADSQLANQTALQIVDSIKKSIDPGVWEGQGGFATVTYYPPNMSIVVSAPAEVQFTVHQAMKRK